MTEWTRPSPPPSSNLRVWLAGGLAGLVISSSMLGALQLVLSQAAPTVVETPSAPPAVVVTIPAAPIVITASGADAPPADVPAPRALQPRLDGRCVPGTSTADAAPQLAHACAWDDGFPAIAGDGSLIAIKRIDDDGGRGNANLAVLFVDPVTSRVVKRVTVLDADEWDPEDKRLGARMIARAAAAQRTLDAGRYRSLERLPVIDSDHYLYDADAPLPSPNITYAEVASSVMRVVDPRTNIALWQGDVSAVDHRRGLAREACPTWSRFETSVAIDRPSGYVLVSHLYRTGGCICADERIELVRRLADPQH